MKVTSLDVPGRATVAGRSFDLPVKGTATVEFPVGRNDQLSTVEFADKNGLSSTAVITEAKLVLGPGRPYDLR